MQGGDLLDLLQRFEVGCAINLLDRRAGLDGLGQVGPLPAELSGRLMRGDDGPAEIAKLLEDQLDVLADDPLELIDEEVDPALGCGAVTCCREQRPEEQPVRALYIDLFSADFPFVHQCALDVPRRSFALFGEPTVSPNRPNHGVRPDSPSARHHPIPHHPFHHATGFPSTTTLRFRTTPSSATPSQFRSSRINPFERIDRRRHAEDLSQPLRSGRERLLDAEMLREVLAAVGELTGGKTIRAPIGRNAILFFGPGAYT